MSAPLIVLLMFCALPPVFAGIFIAAWRGGRRRPDRRWLVVLGNAALALFLVSGALLAGELYYRYVYDTTDSYQAGLISRRWISRHYALNNFGIRDDVDYALAPPPGKTRVTFLGDSNANGHGVADVQDRFVNRIRAAHPEWDVQLIAEDGLDTGGLVERLRSLVASGYVPGRVVYLYCLNDISDLIEVFSGAGERLFAEQPAFLFRGSYLLNTWYYRIRIGRDPVLSRYFDHLARAYRDERWLRQAARLAVLRDLVEEHGGELYVATLPFFELADSDEYRSIHDGLERHWEGAGVPHLDLRDAFEGYAVDELTVNPYDTHPNALAHRLIAEAIDRFLAERRAAGESSYSPRTE